MKKLKLILLCIAMFLTLYSCEVYSCEDAGTLKQIDAGRNDQIEVFKYYYEDRGECVFISRFKDSPKIVTTTWKERQGKHTVVKGNIVIFENDSIQVILKQ